MRLLRGHSSRVHLLAFTPDGKSLLSTAWGADAVTVWDLAAGRRRGRVAQGRGAAQQWALSPTGPWLATLGWSALNVCDVASGDEEEIDLGPYPRAYWHQLIYFAADGPTLRGVFRDWDVPIWRADRRPLGEATQLALPPNVTEEDWHWA
jgi:hypothetical protein